MPLSYKCFIPLFLTIGIVACGDSSNNAALDTLRCVVKSEKPLVMESSFNGVVTKTTVELRGGKMIQTVESNNPRVVDENCKELKSDSDYGEVLCDTESVVAISREEMSESFFEKFKKTFKEACESADDTKINSREDLDSLENTLDSLEHTLSSSSKGDNPLNYDSIFSSDSSEPEFSCEVSKSGDAAMMKLTSDGVTYKHIATLDVGKIIYNSSATSSNKMLVAGICSMYQGSESSKEVVCTDTKVSYKTELEIAVSGIDDVVAMFQQTCDEQEQYYNGDAESSSSSSDFSSSSSFNSSSSTIVYSFSDELETFTDARDGQVYSQVQIGDQLWMGQNLRYADSSALGSENLKGAAWCLDNNPENCKTAGVLYLWHAAMDRPAAECGNGNVCGITEFPHRGICPKDWHVPTQQEWKKLQDVVGSSRGYDLIALSESGSGTDKYGFGAVPTGEYDFRSGYTHRFSSYGAAHFWTATERNSAGANTWYVNGSEFSGQDFDKNMGYAVRCIHD